jgi:hypothetical protein
MFLLAEEYKVINLLGSTVITADLNGTGKDLETYEDDALAIVSTGLVASTSASYVINIQASTALAGVYTTIGSFTALGSASDYSVGAIPVSIGGLTKKYVRAQVDATGADTISAIIGVNLLVKPTVAETGINSASLA